MGLTAELPWDLWKKEIYSLLTLRSLDIVPIVVFRLLFFVYINTKFHMHNPEPKLLADVIFFRPTLTDFAYSLNIHYTRHLWTGST